jgi:hypothetical protein
MSIPARDALELISSIRRQRGFDDSTSNPSPELCGILERALER